MTAAQFLINTSALARLLRPGAESFGWDQAAAAGPVDLAPGTATPFAALCRELWAGAASALGPGLDHTEIARFSELLGGAELRAPQGTARASA